MDIKEPQNCWEFWNCPDELRELCLAYKDKMGKQCYLVSEEHCPKVERGFKSCWECLWFKKVNPHLKN